MWHEGGGHAVNGYKLSQDVSNPDIYYIHVYDNCFPNDIFYLSDGSTMDMDTRVKIKKHKKMNIFTGDVKYTYSYDYNPTDGFSYSYRWATNFVPSDFFGDKLLRYHKFVMYDENNTPLNDLYK